MIAASDTKGKGDWSVQWGHRREKRSDIWSHIRRVREVEAVRDRTNGKKRQRTLYLWRFSDGKEYEVFRELKEDPQEEGRVWRRAETREK